MAKGLYIFYFDPSSIAIRSTPPVRRAGFSRKVYHHSGIQYLHITGNSLVYNQTITGDLQWLEQFWL